MAKLACVCGYVGDSTVTSITSTTGVTGKVDFGSGLSPKWDERNVVHEEVTHHHCPICDRHADNVVYLDCFYGKRPVEKINKAGNPYTKEISTLEWELKAKDDLGFIPLKKWESSNWNTIYWKTRELLKISKELTAKEACKTSKYVGKAIGKVLSMNKSIKKVKDDSEERYSIMDLLAGVKSESKKEMLENLLAKFNPTGDIHIRKSVANMIRKNGAFVIYECNTHSKDKTSKWNYSKYRKVNDLMDSNEQITEREWAEKYLEVFNSRPKWSMERGKVKITRDENTNNWYDDQNPSWTGTVYDPVWEGEYEINGEYTDAEMMSGFHTFFGKPPVSHYDEGHDEI